MTDLPLRTWRGWWLAWPKWFRIGCWAGLGMVVLNVALAARIYVGLMEPAGITSMRNRGASLVYFWELRPKRFRYDYLLMSGLYGRSWSNISQIHFFAVALDEDVRQIGQRCSRLQGLSMQRIDASPIALSTLCQCRRLTYLDVRDTDVNDDVIQQFSRLHQLEYLNIQGTLVTDQSLPILKSLPELQRIELKYTAISSEEINNWRQDNHRRPPVINTVRDLAANRIVGTIRWSDGTCSSGYRFQDVWFLDDPRYSTKMEMMQQTRWYSIGNQFWCRTSEYGTVVNGDYRFKVKFGALHSELESVTVTDGILSREIVEFRMPCTKAEALRSAKDTAN